MDSCFLEGDVSHIQENCRETDYLVRMDSYKYGIYGIFIMYLG